MDTCHFDRHSIFILLKLSRYSILTPDITSSVVDFFQLLKMGQKRKSNFNITGDKHNLKYKNSVECAVEKIF